MFAKIISGFTLGLIMLFIVPGVTQAAESTTELTDEQQAVMDNYMTSSVTSIEELDAVGARGAQTFATLRATRRRGSALMWTEDNVEWRRSNNQVTSSSAWQRAGHIFPNTARNNGIRRHATGTGHRTYRGAHTIGAGVVTPWGDVNVTSQSRVYFLRVNGNGTASSWK